MRLYGKLNKMRWRQGQATRRKRFKFVTLNIYCFIHSKIFVNAKEEMRQKLQTAATPQLCSLFLLFCPSLCTLCISLSSRSIWSSSAILNKTFSPIIVVFFIFFHSKNKNIFSSYVLILPVKLKDKQICFLNHLIAWFSFSCSSWFNLFSYSTIVFCIPLSLFSRFCVILVSLSSFSFWMLINLSIVSFNSLMPCQSWLNFLLLNLFLPM